MTNALSVPRTPWIGVITLCLLLGGCAYHGASGDPVLSDRPGFTDTPVVLPARALQLEAGITGDKSPQGRYLSLGELLLRMGLGQAAELRLFANSFASSVVSDVRTHGFEDPKIGAKIRIRAVADSLHDLRPNVSVLAASTIPAGSAGIGAGVALPELKLALNWILPRGFSFYSNLGVATLPVGGVSRRGRAAGSGQLWLAVSSHVSVFGEAFGAGATAPQDPARLGAVGLTYLVSPQIQVDARAGSGWGVSAGRHFAGVGFSVRR